MSATITRVCSDCGAELSDQVEVWTGSCAACCEQWFAATVRTAPRTMHPLSADLPRERDDFDDADDTASDPLPPSDWWQMDLATQDAATGRQQTGMAGER